jgi:[ribosomal protein S5]-alanine N-acetyltransferase
VSVGARASGTLVELRPLAPEDVTEDYLAWLRDRDVTRQLEVRFERHTLESLRAWVEETGARDDTLLLAIVERASGRHVGNIKVGPLDRRHGTADVGLLIGAKDCWGRGYATEAISLATQLGFEQLGARKLTAGCYASNAASAAAFRRAGWRDEGVRRRQFVGVDGELEDQVLLGVTRDA